MKYVAYVFEKRKGNKMCGVLIIDDEWCGEDKNFEFTPKELLDSLDSVDSKKYEILSNEPIFLEVSQFKNKDREAYSKFRLSKMESILDWWLE